MFRTRIKICGITDAQDALTAARAGADAIGLVFYAASPRGVSIDSARAIVAALPPFVATVGLFVDAGIQEVEETLSAVPLSLLQFHGSEDAQFAQQFHKPYLKAIRMRADVDVQSEIAQHPQAIGILLDAFSKEKAGGTGESFDWHKVPAGVPGLVLAGGLSEANVETAIMRCAPYAVDVSTAVESAPGKKDATKIRQFVAACRAADANREKLA